MVSALITGFPCLCCRVALALSAILTIEDHLLESAAPPSKPLSAGTRRTRPRCCRAFLFSAGRTSAIRSTAWKLPAAQSARATRLLWSARVGAGYSYTGVGCLPCGGRSWSGPLGRSRGGLHARERCNLQRHIDYARRVAQIKLLRRALESQLARFHLVVTARQSRQIETPVFVCPTDPGTPSCRLHQTKIRPGNGNSG